MHEDQIESTEQHVVITLCEKGDDDYCITLRRPDGSVLKVLIPVEGGHDWSNECVLGSKTPFGLNFVFEGHYH